MAKEYEIRVLRVTSANRTSITPKTGEVIYETDTQTLYVGDGVTPGGNVPGGAGGTPDHGTLPGLADDDHTQYHNDVRGDARYYLQATVDAMLALKANLTQLPPSSFAQVSNTDTTTNINTGTNFSNNVPIVGVFANDGGGDFTQSGSTGVICNFNGDIDLRASVHMQSTAVRPNVRIRAKLDGTSFGPVGASSYIRSNSGHNEASSHITTNRITVISGQLITLGSDQEAAAGATTMALSGTSNLYIKRVS